MKNIQYLISHLIVLSLGLILCACSDLLEEDPKSIAVETFYNTPAEAEAAVNSIYTNLRSTNSSGVGVYVGVLDAHVDYAYGRGSYSVLNEFQGLDNVNISRVAGMWEEFYIAIRNANIAIKNIPEANALTKEEIDQFVAEARFLRAFAYFHIVRNWGAIPLRTDENMDIVSVGKSPESEVYNLILNDLLFAEEKLPESQSLIGKPTKWSAKTMLADVYLQLKDYDKSQDKALEVIQSNKFALVPVQSSDDFQKIFGADVITTSEEIFYLKFTNIVSDQGNLLAFLLNHPGTGYLGQGGGAYGLIGYNNDLYFTSWDDQDLRKGLWYYWSIGMGDYTNLIKKFIDPQSLGWIGAGNDQPWYRYSDVLLIYAEASNEVNNGPTSEAMEMLNQVHRRAYGKDPLPTSDVDFQWNNYSKETFLDLIIKERGYEFQYEGKRWLELKRTGKATEIIKRYKGKDIAEKTYQWPIPVKEFNYNKALDPVKDQNPGY